MDTKADKMNLLVTLDANYLPYLNVMLFSLLQANPGCCFDVYLLHSSITAGQVTATRQLLAGRGNLLMLNADEVGLVDAPTTARYPKEIYYRIFAAKYLPDNLDRVLYLDPDLIVNGPLAELYNMPLDDYYFAAASHTGPLMQKVNEIRLDMEDDSPYINSGLMLMNLQRLRAEQNYDDVFNFIEKRRNTLILPDQDIISGLYGSKIFALDTFKYNMTERLFRLHAPFEKDLNLDWVRKNSVIIHYCGRNKPWKENYRGVLDVFYKEAVAKMQQ